MIQTDQSLIRVGRFIKRDNRFVAAVEVAGQVQQVHVPNSGRMQELLLPGAKVGLIDKQGAQRKTRYQLTWAAHENGWVNIDSSMPNKLFMQGVRNGSLKEFLCYQVKRQEVQIGNSRLDVLLEHKLDGRLLYVETKSVTLVEDGVAMFPDAPTTRGSKHLEELSSLAARGIGTAVVFIVQRRDAVKFKPNVKTDPEFAFNLTKAKEAGVSIVAYGCQIQLGSAEITSSIPIEL